MRRGSAGPDTSPADGNMLGNLDFESEATEGTTSEIFTLESELELELELELLELGAERGLTDTASVRRASGPQFGGIFCPSFLQFAWLTFLVSMPTATFSMCFIFQDPTHPIRLLPYMP